MTKPYVAGIDPAKRMMTFAVLDAAGNLCYRGAVSVAVNELDEAIPGKLGRALWGKLKRVPLVYIEHPMGDQPRTVGDLNRSIGGVMALDPNDKLHSINTMTWRRLAEVPHPNRKRGAGAEGPTGTWSFKSTSEARARELWPDEVWNSKDEMEAALIALAGLRDNDDRTSVPLAEQAQTGVLLP